MENRTQRTISAVSPCVHSVLLLKFTNLLRTLYIASSIGLDRSHVIQLAHFPLYIPDTVSGACHETRSGGAMLFLAVLCHLHFTGSRCNSRLGTVEIVVGFWGTGAVGSRRMGCACVPGRCQTLRGAWMEAAGRKHHLWSRAMAAMKK